MYYMCTVCECVYMCVSFYVYVMWHHVVNPYSPSLYYVNVSWTILCTGKLGWLPSCTMSQKKKEYLTHSFQMLSMQMFVKRREYTKMSKDKNRQFSCFCQSLQATESVHWIQRDQLCHGLVGCWMFFVVLVCWHNWVLMQFKAVIRQELCSSSQIQN